MGNKEKKSRRAKLKAKQERLRRQKERLKVLVNIAVISPELIELFKTFPAPTSSDYRCVPLVADYVESEAGRMRTDDKVMSVAIFYAMYVHWYLTGENEIGQIELGSAADSLVMNENFLTQLHGLNVEI